MPRDSTRRREFLGDFTGNLGTYRIEGNTLSVIPLIDGEVDAIERIRIENRQASKSRKEAKASSAAVFGVTFPVSSLGSYLMMKCPTLGHFLIPEICIHRWARAVGDADGLNCRPPRRPAAWGIKDGLGAFIPSSGQSRNFPRRVFTATNISWMNRLECYLTAAHLLRHQISDPRAQLPNWNRGAITTPASALRQLLQHVGHHRTPLPDFELADFGNSVFMLIAKLFLFGQCRREDQSPFLKRVPVAVPFKSDERCLLCWPGFDRAGWNHIDVAVIQSLPQRIPSICPVASEVIPPPGAYECGRAEGKFLAARLGGVDHPDRMSIQACGKYSTSGP